MHKRTLLLLLLAIHAPLTHTMEETIDEAAAKAFYSLANAGFPRLPENEQALLSNDNLRLLDRLCAEQDSSIVNAFALLPCSNEHDRVPAFVRDFTSYVNLVNQHRRRVPSPLSSGSSAFSTSTEHSVSTHCSPPSSPSSPPITRPRLRYAVEVIDDPNDNTNSYISFTFTSNRQDNTFE